MTLPTIHACLFDHDGTLVPTEYLGQLVWWTLGNAWNHFTQNNERKISFSDFNQFISASPAIAYKKVADSIGQDFPYPELKELRTRLVEQFIRNYGITPRPGIVELLTFLQNKGIKLAVATSGKRIDSEYVLKLAGLLDFFSCHIFRDDCAETKPAPDIFLMAARKLGVSPEECLVIEDSVPGVQAALAAGMTTLVIKDVAVIPESELQPADRVVVVNSAYEALSLLRDVI